MELFAKRMTWELDNEEGLSCLSFELEDGYFTLSRKTGAETLRLEMNDPANGQLIDPDCFEYALDNTRFRLNIVRNNRKVLRYLEEHHINTELYGEIVLHYTPLRSVSLKPMRSRTAFPICAGTRTTVILVRTFKDPVFKPCLQTLKPEKSGQLS